jgi:hypothetical protein
MQKTLAKLLFTDQNIPINPSIEHMVYKNLQTLLANLNLHLIVY